MSAARTVTLKWQAFENRGRLSLLASGSVEVRAAAPNVAYEVASRVCRELEGDLLKVWAFDD